MSHVFFWGGGQNFWSWNYASPPNENPVDVPDHPVHQIQSTRLKKTFIVVANLNKSLKKDLCSFVLFFFFI